MDRKLDEAFSTVNESTISKVRRVVFSHPFKRCITSFVIGNHEILIGITSRHLDMTGKTAIKCLLAPAYGKTKKVPKVTNEEEASALMQRLLPQ